MDADLIELLSGLIPDAFRDDPIPVPPPVHPELRQLADERRRDELIAGVGTADSGLSIPEPPFEPTANFRLPDDPDPGLADRIAQGGFEAIAWYVSFHQNRQYWGIYFDLQALASFAVRVFGSLRGSLSDADLLRLTFWTVLNHELFHYRVDAAATLLELGALRPFYLPYRQAHPDLGSEGCRLEEALANAYAWRRARSALGRPVSGSRATGLLFRASTPASRLSWSWVHVLSLIELWLPQLEAEMSGGPPGYRD